LLSRPSPCGNIEVARKGIQLTPCRHQEPLTYRKEFTNMRSSSASAPSTLFGRARANMPLTPAERAVLRLVEGLVCAALVAALPIIADALARGTVSWPDVARAALAAAAVAVLLALAKYARAHGDPAIGQALTAAAGAIDGQSTTQAETEAGMADEAAANPHT
jgi:hypothetical protein